MGRRQKVPFGSGKILRFKMTRGIFFVLLALVVVEGRYKKVGERENDPMPSFEDQTCSTNDYDMCIHVTFPNGEVDMLLLTRDSPTSSIYEGSLEGDEDVG